MTEVTEDSLQAFLDRFYQFYDAVVRKIALDFDAHPPCCEVVVDAQDAESASGWSRVTLRVQACSSFRFEMGRTTFEVLSSGLQVGWSERQVGWSERQILLFLDAYPDDDGLPDVSSNKAFVAGRDLWWSATHINDES